MIVPRTHLIVFLRVSTSNYDHIHTLQMSSLPAPATHPLPRPWQRPVCDVSSLRARLARVQAGVAAGPQAGPPGLGGPYIRPRASLPRIPAWPGRPGWTRLRASSWNERLCPHLAFVEARIGVLRRSPQVLSQVMALVRQPNLRIVVEAADVAPGASIARKQPAPCSYAETQAEASVMAQVVSTLVDGWTEPRSSSRTAGLQRFIALGRDLFRMAWSEAAAPCMGGAPASRRRSRTAREVEDASQRASQATLLLPPPQNAQDMLLHLRQRGGAAPSGSEGVSLHSASAMRAQPATRTAPAALYASAAWAESAARAASDAPSAPAELHTSAAAQAAPAMPSASAARAQSADAPSESAASPTAQAASAAVARKREREAATCVKCNNAGSRMCANLSCEGSFCTNCFVVERKLCRDCVTSCTCTIQASRCNFCITWQTNNAEIRKFSRR